ncbi:MAG: lysophospholipid acyltransferase family protein [Bacteroidota bacterium]
MKDFADRLATGAFLALGAVSRTLPWRARQRFGGLIGTVLKGLSSSRKEVTRSNIALGLPGFDEAARQAVLNESYENLGIVLAELLAIPSIDREELDRMVVIRGLEPIVERCRNGLPTILLTAHYGNWEYGAMAAGIKLNAPVNIVYHPQSNAMADRILNGYRMKFGNVLIPMGSAARALVRHLTEGSVIGIIVDQHGVPEKDPWITFMGRPTPTYEAPASLALRFGAPIFYSCCERRADGTYLVDFTEVPMADLQNDRAGVLELTRRHVELLEQTIRRRPGLWSWQHRRWRGEPPAGATVIAD